MSTELWDDVANDHRKKRSRMVKRSFKEDEVTVEEELNDTSNNRLMTSWPGED